MCCQNLWPKYHELWHKLSIKQTSINKVYINANLAFFLHIILLHVHVCIIMHLLFPIFIDEIVALKRLKMEKEKEGFPITSLREINTLLKAQHHNIVTVRVSSSREYPHYHLGDTGRILICITSIEAYVIIKTTLTLYMKHSLFLLCLHQHVLYSTVVQYEFFIV